MVTVHHGSLALKPLEEVLWNAGLKTLTITPAEPALEDLYVQLVKSKTV